MAQIRSKPFGVTKEGANVTEYTLSNPGGLSVSVLDYGCVIKNIIVPAKNGPVDVVIGHDTMADYEADFLSPSSTCCGAFVGRYANRIENAEFSVGGATYKLEANNGPNHLHGCFNRKLYRVKSFGDTLLMEAESPDGEDGFPGNLKIAVRYTLTEDNAFRMDYRVSSDADTIVNLTNHSYFNLDGGGSTMVGVQYPGYDKCATANSPTDGSMRACANFIFFVREKTEAEAADRLFLYPAHSFALPGATVGFSLKATDANYVASSLPSRLSWSSNYGTLGSNSLTLDAAAGGSISEATVTVKSDGMSGRASITVLKEVTNITVTKEDGKTKLKTLHVPGESSTQLAAGATYYGRAVISAANSFTWDTTGGVGTITQDGKFTAAQVSKLTEGTIEVSYGQTSVSVPVTVSPANPFSDTKGHWAEDYINDLYFEGTITGSTGKDGKLLYRPDDSMTRQEFVVALMRYLGTNLASYDSVALPFVDSKEIGTWALDAMKAAYSLGYMGGSNELGKLYAHPTATITRQEAMVILARTMQADTGSSVDLDKKFTDSAKIADWAKDSLARMVSAGIISGSNGKLNPTGKVTRAEVAKMLWALENQ